MNREEVEAIFEYTEALVELQAADTDESLYDERQRVELAKQRLFDLANSGVIPQSGMVFDVQSGRGFVYEGSRPVDTRELAYRG